MAHIQKIDCSNYIEILGVRISPPQIELTEPFEKKNISEKITIQNVGKSKAFIRIPPLKYENCELECIPRGEYLYQGLKIVKHLKLWDANETANKMEFPIFINEHRYDFTIVINPQKIKLRIVPTDINFGLVTAGTTRTLREIKIQNVGDKSVTFHVDTSNCSRCVLVQPVKGYLRPNTSEHLTVKIMSFMETVVITSFIVKYASKSVKVFVTGNVIKAKLQAFHPNATEFFTLLDFPHIYYGLTAEMPLIIRNYSATSSMFVISGEIYNNIVELSEIRNYIKDATCFFGYPVDGVFEANETKMFSFGYKPIKTQLVDHQPTFHLCSILIISFRCDHLTRSILMEQKDKYKHDSDTPLASIKGSTKEISFTSSSSFNLNSDSANETLYEVNLFLDAKLERHFLRIHLYGSAELPRVTIRPDELTLRNCSMDKCEVRVIELKNMSSKLPIILRAIKTRYIIIKDQKVILKPLQNIEISVQIFPRRIGAITCKVTFDLLYYDSPKTLDNLKVIGHVSIPLKIETFVKVSYPKPQLNTGLTPNYLRDVGQYCQNIRFNTPLSNAKLITAHPCKVIDRNCSYLVALPNDTQNSLRPFRRSIPCLTIFTRQPKYVEPINSRYELRPFDAIYKSVVGNYYNKYIRSFNNRARIFEESIFSDYKLTEERKLLCEDLSYLKQLPLKQIASLDKQYDVHLTTREMAKVIVSPLMVHSGQIATDYEYWFTVNITNKNNYRLRVLLRSEDPDVLYFGKASHSVQPLESVDVDVKYKTLAIGYYTSNIVLVVNECMMMTVPVFVEVVPRALQLSTNLIELNQDQNHRYIEMRNNLNVSIPFIWMIVNHNFLIEPPIGSVRVGGKLTCIVRFLQEIEGPLETEAQLHCDSSHVQKIKLVANFRYKTLELNKEQVVFEDIPLNQSINRFAAIRNSQGFPVNFTIENSLSCIQVYPRNGNIPANCEIILYLTAHFCNCVKFSDVILIKNMKSELKLPVYGNVVYPQIEVIPKVLNMDKIPSSSTTNIKFLLKNNNVIPVSIKFDMEDYQEFVITESENLTDKSKQLTSLVIQEHTTTALYLHFDPCDMSSSTFYLPIILNDILGPPILGDIISTKVQYYLTELYDNCDYTKVPESLPCIKVRCLATLPKVMFSKQKMVFSTYAANRDDVHLLKVVNPQQLSEDIFIRTENLSSPIYVLNCCDDNIKRTKCGVLMSLLPGQSANLKIMFKPNNFHFGLTYVEIPVFLRSDNSSSPHITLTIYAKYNRPSIERYIKVQCSDDASSVDDDYIFYTLPLSPMTTFFVHEELMLMKNHLKDCKIMVLASCPDDKPSLLHNTKNVIDENQYTIVFRLAASIAVEEYYSGFFQISCSCGGYWHFAVTGTVEKSILTCYCYYNIIFNIQRNDCTEPAVSKTANNDDTTSMLNYERSRYTDSMPHLTGLSYPMFPKELDNFAEAIVAAAELWMTKQVLFNNWIYSITDNIKIPDFNQPTEECLKRQTQLSCVPLVHIISNLVGSKVLSYLNTSEEDLLDNFDDIKRLHKIYNNCLEFLRRRGASLVHLRPESLLSYDHFLEFKTKIFEQPSPPYPITVAINSRKEFLRLSKQSWLDVVLQAFKVLSLHRVTGEKSLQTLRSVAKPMDEFLSISLTNKFSDALSDSESLLLNWIDYHFHSNKNNVWSDGDKLPMREISFFNDSFKDSLVLAVVTATYCPYLTKYLERLYLFPESYEELFHNATTLISAWEMINYSFTITPDNILTSNMVLMVMFTSYLFEVLPYMYPTEELSFSIGLSQNVTKKMMIFNPNTFPIAYKPIVMTNEDTCFSTLSNLYVLKPKEKFTLTIRYFAKLAEQVNAVLILSGEISGYRYANNKCITLIGNPDLEYATTTISYPLPLYKMVEVDFVIQSPYKTAAVYNMQQTNSKVGKPLELAHVLYHYQSNRLGCGRFILTNKDYIFDEDGVCEVHGIVTTLHQVDITNWVYFRNNVVGDFAIKLVSIISDLPDREVLTVDLPNTLMGSTRRRKPKTNQLIMKVPCQNRLFFEAMQTLMIRLTADEEQKLWQRIIATPMGVNLLTRLVEHSQRSLPFHCLPAVYKVEMSEDADVILPDTVTFEDECSPGFLDIPIAMKEPGTIPNSFYFMLKSEEMERLRAYYVQFN